MPDTRTVERPRFTPAELAAIFEKHKPLAQKFANSFSSHYGLGRKQAYDDALSEMGELISQFNDVSKFNRDLCGATHWIYQKLYWRLLTLYTRKQGRAIPFTNLKQDEQKPLQIAEPDSWIGRLRRDLGEDARILVETVLHAPAEIYDDVSTSHRGRARRAVADYLEDRGWDRKRIKTAWTEVQSCLV